MQRRLYLLRFFSSWMSIVRVYGLSPGSAHTRFNLFVGKLDQVFFYPAQWWWPKVTHLMAYSTKLGKTWITLQVALRKSILDKWSNGIPPSNSLRWNIIWHEHKAEKKTTFLWSKSQGIGSEQIVWEDLNRGRQKLSPLWFKSHGVGGAHVRQLSVSSKGRALRICLQLAILCDKM